MKKKHNTQRLRFSFRPLIASPRRRRHEGPIPAVDTAEAAEELGIEVLRRGCGRCGGEAVGVTLPETNIAHENRPLEKEIPIGNHHF